VGKELDGHCLLEYKRGKISHHKVNKHLKNENVIRVDIPVILEKANVVLKEAGVKLYVCGQALADDNFKPEWINPEIVLSLSALVDVLTFQLKGYAYLPF
jgi:intracellular sulfur oxidation DsrE/DsrF family protein